MANTFTMNGKKMVLNRGRYKEEKNVGSVNEKKGSGFLNRVGQGVKALGARVKAETNLAREKGKAKEMDASRAAIKAVKAAGRGAVTDKEVKMAKKATQPKKELGDMIGTHASQIRAAEAEINKQYKN